jgi:hypothetical protein
METVFIAVFLTNINYLRFSADLELLANIVSKISTHLKQLEKNQLVKKLKFDFSLLIKIAHFMRIVVASSNICHATSDISWAFTGLLLPW